MTVIMSGEATSAQIAAFAVALRMKGETATEIAALARIMREYAVKIPVHTDKPLVDPVGTGGDALKTFNISTSSALVAVATGSVAVAKHGNRAATSKCGSADVLEASGVNLNASPATIAKCIDEIGIGFLYAPQSHPALKYAAAPRKEIGVKTVFNILGPLTNPSGATRQLIGVNSADQCALMAEALRELGCQRAMVVFGVDGIDELSTLGETLVMELEDGEITSWKLNAQRDLGIPIASLEEIAASDSAAENARIMMGVLDGSDKGARRDIVALNAAATLVVGGVAKCLNNGLEMAYKTLESGSAAALLEKLVKLTQE